MLAMHNASVVISPFKVMLAPRSGALRLPTPPQNVTISCFSVERQGGGRALRLRLGYLLVGGWSKISASILSISFFELVHFEQTREHLRSWRFGRTQIRKDMAQSNKSTSGLKERVTGPCLRLMLYYELTSSVYSRAAKSSAR